MHNRVVFDDMQEIADRNDYAWLEGKSVFISGAYGMLASYIVYFFIYLNEIVLHDKIGIYAQGRNLSKMQKRFGLFCDKEYFHIITDDICSEINISKKMDYIVHAASLASPQYYATNPVDVIAPNVLGTNNLLKMAREHGTSGFLFFSSGEVYGKIEDLQHDCTEHDYGYLDIMNVRSCYAESKRLGETLCKSYFVQYGVPATAVRIAHTYGPTMDVYTDERVFSEFVKNVMHNENIVMKSDGLSERYFCYLTDAVDAFLRILKNGSRGEAYNMCNTSASMSIRGLAELLVELFEEKNLKVIAENRIKSSRYMESPVKKSPVFDTSKLQELGWRPQIDVKEGFWRTVMSLKNEVMDCV